MPAKPEPTTVPPGLSRRGVLGLMSACFAGSSQAAFAQGPSPQPILQTLLGEGQKFDPGLVVEVARQLARRPSAAPASNLPDVFANLTSEQYAAIKALPSTLIWAGENRGVMVEPLHRGFVYSNPVTLFVVEDGVVRRIAYDRGRFDFGRLAVPPNVGDLGFSGAKLYASLGGGDLAEFAIIQGATFFRALARGQDFGVMARALTLKPAEARGEEFPIWRAFWLEKPGTGANSLVVHAILDSESVSGAVRMTFRPGEVTIVDVELTLFPRVTLDHVGIGGMGASFLFGANDRRNVDDVRPAVHETKGLQMANGQGEWLWRPLHNPETLQISAFLDRSPKAFGLVQRDRDYATFQDDEQHWERRPTLWIEPLGDWGEGVVQLIEIPSDNEINDNILAYWRPRTPIAAGSEASLAYRQYWCWTPPEKPPLATVTSTRVGRSSGRKRRFLVDFTGDMLAGGEPQDLRPTLTTGPGAIQNVKLWSYPERKTIRVAFDLDPGNENACEMRLLLEVGGKPVSETWLYRWTP